MSRIQGGLTAPTSSSSDRKLHQNFQLPEEGIHQAILIGVIAMGTFSEKYMNEPEKDRQKIMLIWEFPELKQLVYEDDQEKRSYIKYDEMGFSMHEKSKLTRVISALDNGKTKDFRSLDLFSLIGERVIITIKHVHKNVDGEEKTYVNIEAYSRVGKMPAPENFISDGDRYMWYPDKAGEHFTTQNFAELPGFIRKKISESKEGIAHKANGGSFAEPKENENNPSGPASPKEEAKASVPKGYGFQDITGNGYTYDQYKAMGWKDKQLLEKGYLKKVATAPAPPAPEAPAAPPAPAAPEASGAIDPFAEDDDDLPY